MILFWHGEIMISIVNSTIEFDKKQCCDRAQELFIKESGCGKDGAKYEKMRTNAFEIRKLIEPRIDVKCTYKIYNSFELKNETLIIENEQFNCTAFGQINPKSVDAVIFYAVTAGNYYLEDRPIMDQLYADIWGTAFTDAMREIFMDEMKKNYKISDSFGPGFYGMDVTEMKKMPKFVSFDSLGMEVKNSCVILPLKSCAGIIYIVNELYTKLDSACQLCYGNKKTCSLCSIRNNSI